MTGRPALTDQQQRAVAARDFSVALSAGAGCGKTFVLTERFLAQLKPDGQGSRPRLGQVVAITFTERAAREMRDRIRAACHQRLIEAAEQDVAHWLELLRELDGARIATIHSFCGSLLRAHAVEIGLDPQFRVLDQAQADTLLFELLDGELRQRLARRDEAVIELVVRYGLERLHEMIRTLLGRRQDIDFDAWGDETPEQLALRWETYWRETTVPGVLRQVAESPAAESILRIAREQPPSNPKMQQRCAALIGLLPRLAESEDPPGDLALIEDNARVQGGGGKKAWPSEAAYGEFRDAAKELRDAVKRHKPSVAFNAEAARPAAETALRLLSVAAGVAEAYQGEKQRQGALDFNDLLILARELLTGPDRRGLRKRLASQIRLLLVDEFQDTDALQVELVKALCNDEISGGRLFFVGDYKQSIYRFRGADPHVFRQLRGELPERGRLPLSLNFRSQPAVIDFVNTVFRDEMGPEYEPLVANRPQVTPTPAVEFLWAADAEDAGENPAADEASQPDRARVMQPAEQMRRREADWIARRLRAMLDGQERIVLGEPSKDGQPATRPVRPGDVAVLFRALSNVEYYEEALRRYDVPYYLVGGHAFYSQQEVFDLLNLLRTLDSPCDEVSLAGVLRSPMFSLFDETLFLLAQHPQGLADGLLAGPVPPKLAAGQRERVEFASATLSTLRAMKDRLPVAQLISEALTRTGYDAILTAEFLGERKLANLKKLIEQARSFDRAGIFTLADFITQLKQFVARQPDEALAATHGESSDVVRLMTIHQSKGLEFPVVVVADLGRRSQNRSASVTFTPQLGPMVKDPEATSGFDLHAAAEREQEREERTRLFYVATTRAADYLVLSAGVRQLGKPTGPWLELLSRRFGDAMWGGGVGVDFGDGVLGDGDSGDGVFGDGVEIRVISAAPSIDVKPSHAARRPNLDKVVEAARHLVDHGGGRRPPHLNAVAPDASARRQFSFSRLFGTLHAGVAPTASAEAADPTSDDATAGPPPLDPRGLGTLVHAVLENIDFRDPPSVRELVARHAPRHLPDVAEPAAGELDEPIEIIERFIESPRAAELAAADRVHAELEFLLAWPPGNAETGGPIVQGFIDCLYRDAVGDWRLVDFKTNHVTPSTLPSVAANYEMQMLLYALATEQILGCPPAELVLCFLRPGLEQSFAWNLTARKRVIEMVERAICEARAGSSP